MEVLEVITPFKAHDGYHPEYGWGQRSYRRNFSVGDRLRICDEKKNSIGEFFFKILTEDQSVYWIETAIIVNGTRKLYT